MADATTAWQAIAGAASGGAGLKLIEYWLSRNKRQSDDATQMRNELRAENARLQAQIDKANTDREAAVKVAETVKEKADDDVTEWREKYYDLLDQLIELKKGSMETPLIRKED